MAIGLVGRKVGMTRVFTDEGVSVPVTVIQVDSNRVSQIRTLERDGYEAIQVASGDKKASRMNKPETGHFVAAGIKAAASLMEFRATASEFDGLEIGSELTVERFQEGQVVDVTGVSKGKGFAGGAKRHNFRTQDMTHGNSLSHRAPGSIGQNQTPGRVFKGKKMAGHMGNAKRTAQSLKVVRIDTDRSLILVKGSVPGAPGGPVVIKPSIKA